MKPYENQEDEIMCLKALGNERDHIIASLKIQINDLRAEQEKPDFIVQNAKAEGLGVPIYNNDPLDRLLLVPTGEMNGPTTEYLRENGIIVAQVDNPHACSTPSYKAEENV
jgi:hypothetical protein